MEHKAKSQESPLKDLFKKPPEGLTTPSLTPVKKELDINLDKVILSGKELLPSSWNILETEEEGIITASCGTTQYKGPVAGFNQMLKRGYM
jgi:hypothetical protein